MASIPLRRRLDAAGKGPKIVRDLKLYDGELPALEPISIEGVK